MQISVPSQRKTKRFWKKLEKTSLVVHLLFLHAKQLLLKLLSESLPTYASLLLGLMPANYIPTRCVNQCRPVLIRVGLSIQKPEDSHLGKTKPVALKTSSCLIFNEQDLILKLGASALQADRKELTASVLVGFFSLQYCIWSNSLFLSLLFLSRDSPISHWRRYQTWLKEKRSR